MKKELKKYIPWIILLLVILSLSLWYVLSRRVTQEQLELYNERVEEAATHAEARQYSVAIEKYYEAVDIVPKKVEAYEGIVSVLLLKNRIDDAKQVVEKSAKPLSNNDRSILYNMIGDAYSDVGKYREAFDMYDAGLVLGVKNMQLELSLGKIFLKLGDINQAKKQFQKQGYEEEVKMEANLLLAYIYAVEDVSNAKKTLSSVKPSGSMQVNYEEFKGVLDSLDDDEKFNASKLARIYINNGYPYLAILVLEPLKENMSEYLEGMYFLGRAYFDFGDYEKAIETLDRALTLGGMETEILWTKARAYLMDNDLDNMVKSYDGAIGYAGAEVNSDLVKEYIDILLDNKQGLKANELVKDLLLLLPDEPYLNLLSVKTHYNLNESVKVDFYLSKLEGLELTGSDDKEYLQWKIMVLLESDGDVDEYMVKLVSIDKFNPYYNLFLAQTQIKDNEVELAIQSLEKAIEYDLEYEVTEEARKLLSSLR